MDDPVLEQHFAGHKGVITSLSFNPTGKHLLSSSEDHTFMNWNLNSSSGSLRYKAKPLPVSYVSFSPNGSLIASAQGQYVRLWLSTIRGKSIEFRTHFSMVRSVQFSPDSNKLVTASDDKSLKIWDTTKRKFISSLSGSGGHTNWVRFGTYAPDSHLIASCSDDKTIKLWDPITSKLVHTFNEVRGVPRNVNFHPSNLYIGVAMATGTVKLYDLKMMKLLQYYPCHGGFVNSLSFHPDGTYLITAGDDCTTKVIDLIEGRAILSLEGHQKAVTAVTFSSSGNKFATASADKSVFIWRTNLNDLPMEYNENIIKESLSNDCISIPRLTKSPPKKSKEPDTRGEYCAKNYEEYEHTLKPDNNLVENFNSEYNCQKEMPADIRSANEIPLIIQSINDLTKQVAHLANKLTEMETRLTQMEEAIRYRKNV